MNFQGVDAREVLIQVNDKIYERLTEREVGPIASKCVSEYIFPIGLIEQCKTKEDLLNILLRKSSHEIEKVLTFMCLAETREALRQDVEEVIARLSLD